MSWLYNIKDFLFIDMMISWDYWRKWAKNMLFSSYEFYLTAQAFTWDIVDTSDVIVECAFVFVEPHNDLCFHWHFIRIVGMADVKGSFELPSLSLWKVRTFLCCTNVPVLPWLNLMRNNNNRRELDQYGSLNYRAEHGKLLNWGDLETNLKQNQIVNYLCSDSANLAC